MSADKEHKIKRMRKKHVWPTFVLTIGSFVFSSIVVGIIVIYLCIFTFNGKINSAQENADDLNYALESHLNSEVAKVSIYKEQLKIENVLNGNLDDLQTELKQICEMGKYAEVGVWVMGMDTPYTANSMKFLPSSSFYQAFLNGKEGIYSEFTESGRYLVYTTVLQYDETHQAVLFVVENASLNLEGIVSTVENPSLGTYILDSNNQTLAWVGSKEDKLSYADLMAKKIDKVIGYTFSTEETIYLESCNGLIESRGSNAEPVFNASYLMQPDETEAANQKSPIEGSFWFEKEMRINGWKTVSNQHLILNRVEMDKLIQIGRITLIILFVPFIAMIVLILSQLYDRRKLTNLLYLDNVTGGKNWLYFKNTSSRIMKKRKYRDETYAMIAFEVNHFRIFCDYNGSDAGDDLLENLNRQLVEMTDSGEVFGRYAGAHFGMLLKYNSEEQLNERLQQMLNELSRNCTKERISFSAGVYIIPDKTVLVESLYNYACGAKNTVREQLKTQIAMFDFQIRDKQLWEKEVENTMERAIENKEFVVYLQPKYSTSTKVISGAEALVRWISEEKGFVSPGLFIPVFEKNGFITRLDDYMLESVAKLQAQWVKEGRNVVPISVNVSRAHFANPDLAEHIRDIVDTQGAPHEFIELELTESAFFDDKNVLLNTVKKLQEYGFAVSMDDFGAGYSSLNSLKDLPLDVVKLDGEFFRDSDDKERGESVVRDTILLAKNLNMKIVAEGIETKEQVGFLTESGCDFIQGFYFARPMPVDEFEQSAFAEKRGEMKMKDEKKNYEYILFDLDGTITDSKRGIINSLDYALRSFGIETDDLDSLCKFIGPPVKTTFEKGFGFSEEKADLGVIKYREYFSVTGIFENETYSGIEEVLQKLRENGKKIMLATSKPIDFTVRILDHFNLNQYFDFVAGSEMDGGRSTKGEVIQYVIDENHILDLSKVIMIGDRKYDIIGAKEAGIDSAGVLYGFGDEAELLQAGADYIIEKIEDIMDLA